MVMENFKKSPENIVHNQVEAAKANPGTSFAERLGRSEWAQEMFGGNLVIPKMETGERASRADSFTQMVGKIARKAANFEAPQVPSPLTVKPVVETDNGPLIVKPVVEAGSNTAALTQMVEEIARKAATFEAPPLIDMYQRQQKSTPIPLVSPVNTTNNNTTTNTFGDIVVNVEGSNLNEQQLAKAVKDGVRAEIGGILRSADTESEVE
ncbi:hypothetical protein D9M68_719030 [compost metagenome]